MVKRNFKNNFKNDFKNNFIKKQICLLLILCLSAGLFTGCGKNTNPAENTGNIETTGNAGNVETAGNTGNMEAVKDTMPDADTENTDTSDKNADGQDIPNMEILHAMIATKEIYMAKPNDSAPFIRVKWNTVTLSEEDAEKYPRLAKALAAYAREQDDLAEDFNHVSRSEIYEYFDDMEAELIADGAYTEDWYLRQEEWPYFLNFEHQKYLNIVRCDEVAFTVQEDFSDYMGGAHGYYAYYGKNFDTQTGHRLMVEDVVKDLGKLNQILHDKLMTEYEDLMLEDAHIWDDLNSKASGEYDYAWLLAHDKVTFYFNPYELTSFAGGMQVIDICFSEYPDLFEEKYTKAPEEYVLHLGKNGETLLDVDGDGKSEKISVYVIEQNTSYPEGTAPYRSTISVNIDGEKDNFSVPDGYDGDIYLVHTGSSTYLYFNTKIYDYSSLMCIDLSGGYAKRVHREGRFEPYLEDEKFGGEDLWYAMNESRVEKYMEAFTDTNHLTMSQAAERIIYHVGDDGMPEKEDAKEKQPSGRIKAIVPDRDTDYAGTYWVAAYIEEFGDLMTDEERFTEYDNEKHLDLFVYEDGTALLRSILNNRYEAYACKGRWVSDNRGGIFFEDCTDMDGDEREYYDSYLVPHIYPAEIEIDGESGLLAMEFYDKCLYLRQDKMPDAQNDFYSGIDLSNMKKVKSAIQNDNLSGEWVLSSIRTENRWTNAKDMGVVCTISIWNENADFYYYSEEEGRSEQYYGMTLVYEEENFSEENTKGYTIYAYPDEAAFEGRDYVLYFRIAPFRKSLMAQKVSQNWEGESSVDGLYYFYREEKKVSPITITNPGWEYYCAQSLSEETGHIRLERLSQEENSIINADVWFAAIGKTMPDREYQSDGNYQYHMYGEDYYGFFSPYMLEINDAGGKKVAELDFSEFYTPDNYVPGDFLFVSEEIHSPRVVDGILYLSIFHMTYASSAPHNGYIMAIDMEDGYRVLWKSEPLTCNADNFEIVDNTIICGYGFTDEDDFIYLLDKNTGRRIDKIKVKTGPDYFYVVEDKLYVRTYDTDYVFQINR